jgi:hypothetical protein
LCPLLETGGLSGSRSTDCVKIFTKGHRTTDHRIRAEHDKFHLNHVLVPESPTALFHTEYEEL